ncbi:tRNA 2-thiouridine(34) synthase MnmA [Candidatus Caldatribacterium saccharofermentans]|uniref:tRNA 2-thiouridine(34) synthase MnmA n=1 Tax=Candidatus Caldatribacterium saccharofermentans TaxID=1454753 RepID=UPI003CFDF1E0
MKQRVLVAMSGGVDSSVACLLLKEAGFEVIGVTMCLGEEGGEARCCGARAVEDARAVCHLLGVPHFVLDFSQDMEDIIIANFIAEYRRGRTPNPCVLCNRHLKFGRLLEYARALGCDFLATGHYALLEKKDGRYVIRRPKDRKKDQTYFLSAIPKEALPFLLFPLGHYTKEEVREIARKAALPVAEKPQSQDLCFIPGGNYREFLLRHLGEERPGNIVTRDGKVLGQHRGIFHYTIGQRRGLGIRAPYPLYVIAINPERNEIVVGRREELLSFGLVVKSFNWLVDEPPRKALVQVRYQQKPQPCFVETGEHGAVTIVFEQPLEMVTPGQVAVLYEGDVLLGGGPIEEVWHEKRSGTHQGTEREEECRYSRPQLPAS